MKIDELLREYRSVWAIDHARSLLEWDLEVNMPVEGTAARGEALAQLTLIRREYLLRLRDLVSKYRDFKDLSDLEKGVIRVLDRELKYYTLIPPEVLEELDRTATKAAVIWREARRESNFSKFKPYLSKILELERTIADKLGYEGHPYNALLDLYEEGFTVNDADHVFNTLLPNLKALLDKIMSEGKYPSRHPLEDVPYDVNVMKSINEELLRVLEMPVGSRFRMDVSAHPFTTGISINDVRITTRYEGRDFRSTMFSVIHESGHAMYELMIDPSLDMTPVGRGVSMGVHESQSRFWENIIGRSREFVHLIYPLLKERLPFLRDYSEEDIYRYFNIVRPSLIRVDADEVTYNFHIALRYEVEKGLIAGKLDVSDLPSLWNDFMDKYLGVRPRNDAEGVLQDIHWSQGSFGYFPTYTLGNVVAGMIYAKLPGLRDKVAGRRFNEIREFLRDKICKYGAIYPPKELLMRSFNDTYNPTYLLNYLREKYLG
ncbi:carboxypeptidase M32 [Vulcanisaeta souniana]|uniref:Metal-dependent carboxypeptidase n=1 Tax=Vulcanisaeta souniana JCM 11219 TaxID=1293586 RepID=A0A830E3N6_9CREN|nr:carboxypeptidase M32 [Vulcanisaeta souniana]BDR92127.1 carboxypeptidase M32 [Vulcanisaeta souniana JCM 11219]GGI67726.1 carboxypeptidase M32 [Vulcanisaeta souniana JCM 11219]